MPTPCAYSVLVKSVENEKNKKILFFIQSYTLLKIFLIELSVSKIKFDGIYINFHSEENI